MSDDGRITYRYVQAAGYRRIPASGVWGGITPDGNIIANFFVDAPEIPLSITHELRAGGVLGEEISRDYQQPDSPSIERSLEVGVVMSAERARSVGQWLLSKAEELEAAATEQGEDD